MVDFELAGLTEFDTGAAAGEGFAAGAGADAEVLAAGAAGAGAAAGALLALVSSAVFFFRDFLAVVVSLVAAVWLVVALLSVVFAALVSSAVFFLCDFLVVLADVSLLAAVCELADLSSVAAVSFFDFFDFFFVVVSLVVVVSVELDWAATIDGMNVSRNAKQSTADNKPNLLHEFIFLALHE